MAEKDRDSFKTVPAAQFKSAPGLKNILEAPVSSILIDSPTGKIKIASSNGFVHSISFSDSEESLTTLNAEPPAELVQCAIELGEYFAGKREVFSFPYAQSGTGFQQRVWSELAKIPFGKTISYQQLANILGDPKVIRAAASANGRNSLAIVVPCHRVIGKNGTLVGYAGGLANKRWLLAHEAKFFHGVQSLF